MVRCTQAVLPNWCNEFRKWAPTMPFLMYDGPSEERKALKEEVAAARYTVLLTHYDLVLKDKSALRKVGEESIRMSMSPIRPPHILCLSVSCSPSVACLSFLLNAGLQ
jgi:hypothetical protein